MSKFYNVPCRWLPRTFFTNVHWILRCIFWTGPKNLIRWAPVIWLDEDYDWSFLAKIMQYKLSRMSKGFYRWGHHTRAEKDSRRMQICAYLLKRLVDDEYFINTEKAFPTYNRKGTLAQHVAEQDEELLFTIMRKHWRGWWD